MCPLRVDVSLLCETNLPLFMESTQIRSFRGALAKYIGRNVDGGSSRKSEKPLSEQVLPENSTPSSKP
jgi:hypothetical protein